jgi:hypothetical protein
MIKSPKVSLLPVLREEEISILRGVFISLGMSLARRTEDVSWGLDPMTALKSVGTLSFSLDPCRRRWWRLNTRPQR